MRGAGRWVTGDRALTWIGCCQSPLEATPPTTRTRNGAEQGSTLGRWVKAGRERCTCAGEQRGLGGTGSGTEGQRKRGRRVMERRDLGGPGPWTQGGSGGSRGHARTDLRRGSPQSCRSGRRPHASVLPASGARKQKKSQLSRSWITWLVGRVETHGVRNVAAEDHDRPWWKGLGSTTTMREGQTCNNSIACREGTRDCMQRGANGVVPADDAASSALIGTRECPRPVTAERARSHGNREEVGPADLNKNPEKKKSDVCQFEPF